MKHKPPPNNLAKLPNVPPKVFSVKALAKHLNAHPASVLNVICRLRKENKPLVWMHYHFIDLGNSWLAVHDSDLNRVEIMTFTDEPA